MRQRSNMHLSPRTSRPRGFLAAGALAAVLGLALAGCGDNVGVLAPDAQPPDAQQPELVRVQILGLNDFHGNLEPPAGSGGRIQTGTTPEGQPETVDAGGVIYFARHIAALRATEPNTVVVSAGDLIGATPLISALFRDEPTIEAMNLVGLDINGVGNHEFDRGKDELLRMQHGGCHPEDDCQEGEAFAGAQFKFLAANVVTTEDTTLFPAYDIREFEGVKIAFIGMTLEGTPEIVTPTGVAGLQFKDEVETVNALVPELQAQGVRAIVVVVHEGGYPTGLYDGCDGISGPIVDIVNGFDAEVDAVVTGHTHQAYNCVINGKIVTSAASAGRVITDIDLMLDKTTGDVVHATARNIIVTRDVEPVPALEELVAHYDERSAAPRSRVIGEATEVLTREQLPSGDSVIGNIIADAQLFATQDAEFGGAVVAFMNPGGVRADIDEGEITYGEAFTVQPFGNSLVTMTLTGAQIHALLEQQWTTANRVLHVSGSFSYTWSDSAAAGSKVDPSTIRIGGDVLDLEASYRVTANSFLAAGGDRFSVFVAGTNRLGGALDLDALEAYLQVNNPISAPSIDRITRID